MSALQASPLSMAAYQPTSSFSNGGAQAYSSAVSGGQQQYYSSNMGGNYTTSTTSYTANGMTEIPTGQRLVTGGGPERIQSTRKVSSTIIEERIMGNAPPSEMPVKYVEIEGPPQEEVKYVTKKEVKNTVRHVTVPQYVKEDKIVEVNVPVYVPKEVIVPVEVEQRIERPVPQYIDQPYDVIKEVKRPYTVKKEVRKEVPGPVVEVPKPYRVEQPYNVNVFHDRQTPVVVAQTIKPYIVEGQTVAEVDVYEYVPEMVPVDVHVIKPVQAQIVAAGVTESMHRVIAVPAAQYNSMLQQLNIHLSSEEQQKLPFQKDMYGKVAVMQERMQFVYPQAGVQIQGFNEAGAVHTHKETQTTTTTTTTQQQIGGGSMTVNSYGPGSASLMNSSQQSMQQQYYLPQTTSYEVSSVSQLGRPMPMTTVSTGAY